MYYVRHSHETTLHTWATHKWLKRQRWHSLRCLKVYFIRLLASLKVTNFFPNSMILETCMKFSAFFSISMELHGTGSPSLILNMCTFLITLSTMRLKHPQNIWIKHVPLPCRFIKPTGPHHVSGNQCELQTWHILLTRFFSIALWLLLLSQMNEYREKKAKGIWWMMRSNA